MSETKPELKKGRSFSAIWIVPIVAAVLGVWMVVYTYMTEGPTIEITFKTADGLEAGKTKVKYRSVEVGLVQDVRLGGEQENVVATVQLEKEVTDLLRDDTDFWVVTARVGAGGISGLDTILSGAYLALAPGEGQPGRRKFQALDEPPLTPAGAPGLRLELVAEYAASVSAGDSVLFNGYQVGRVESMKFDSANKLIRYSVFIDAPYHELVNDAVRFYDVSGISLQASADGISVNTGSLDTVLLGGVAFSLPTGMQRGQPVQKGTEFKLYPSLEAIDKNPYRYGAYYVMSFNQSLRGLHPGAPVEYRGLRLGRVERILLKEFTSSGLTRAGAPIPVLVYLEPGRLEIGDTSGAVDMLNNAVIKGVPLGMRATLATGNLLTGALYINVDYFDDVEPAEVGEMFGYPTFPTVSGGFERIERQVNRLLEKFNNLPLEDTVATVNGAVAELESTLASLDVILEDSSTQALPAEIGKAVKELRATLKGFDPDSPLYQSLNASMYELNRTLENLRALTKTLSEQPNAALLPVELPPDPVPEARP